MYSLFKKLFISGSLFFQCLAEIQLYMLPNAKRTNKLLTWQSKLEQAIILIFILIGVSYSNCRVPFNYKLRFITNNSSRKEQFVYHSLAFLF